MSLKTYQEIVTRALQNNIQVLEDNIESVDEDVRLQWEGELTEYRTTLEFIRSYGGS